MHVANIRPKKNWQDLETLITESIGETGTISEGKQYEIYNNGGSTAYAMAQEKEPGTAGNGALAGRCIFPAGAAYVYTAGVNKLYLKSAGECDLHVEEL